MAGFSVRFSIEETIYLYCRECGNGLEVKSFSNSATEFDVIPCQHCIEEARNLGFDDGREEGLRDAA